MNLWGLTGLQIQAYEAKTLTEHTIMDYFRRLRLLAVSMFDWQGLPESVNIRYLESTLFDTGRVLFFQDKSDKGLDYLALRCTIANELNVYMEPTKFIAISNQYSHEYSLLDSVLIRNNYESIPTALTIMLFAQRLANAERTIDINIAAQKTPLLILCDEKERMTIKNIYAQYKGDEPVIFGNKSLNPDLLKVLKTDAPFVADKIMTYKMAIMNECLTYLGINNANTVKKERLITDEAQSNNQMISMSAQVMLTARQQAAKQINDMFGLNVSVELREQPLEEVASDKTTESKGEDNG